MNSITKCPPGSAAGSQNTWPQCCSTRYGSHRPSYGVFNGGDRTNRIGTMPDVHGCHQSTASWCLHAKIFEASK